MSRHTAHRTSCTIQSKSLKIFGEWQSKWRDGENGIVYQGNLKIVGNHGTIVVRRDLPDGSQLTDRIMLTLFPDDFIILTLLDTARAEHGRDIFVAQERGGPVVFLGVMDAAGIEAKLLSVTAIQ